LAKKAYQNALNDVLLTDDHLAYFLFDAQEAIPEIFDSLLHVALLGGIHYSSSMSIPAPLGYG